MMVRKKKKRLMMVKHYSCYWCCFLLKQCEMQNPIEYFSSLKKMWRDFLIKIIKITNSVMPFILKIPSVERASGHSWETRLVSLILKTRNLSQSWFVVWTFSPMVLEKRWSKGKRYPCNRTRKTLSRSG